MSTRRYWSYIIAATAATVALLSSWLPWYGLRLGVSMSAAASQAKAAGGFAVLADLMLRQLAGVRADAWQALDVWPAVLVAGAIAAGVLASLASSGRLRDRRWDLVMTGAAAVALLFVAIHIVNLPGPSSAIQPLWGAYVAAAGAGVAMVAGLVAHLDKSGPAVALNASSPLPVPVPLAVAPPAAPAFDPAPPAPVFEDAAVADPVFEEAPPAPVFEDAAPSAPVFEDAAVAAPVFDDAPVPAPVVEDASPAPSFEDAAFAAPVVEDASPAPSFEDAAFAAPVVDEAQSAPSVADEPEALEPATEPEA